MIESPLRDFGTLKLAEYTPPLSQSSDRLAAVHGLDQHALGRTNIQTESVTSFPSPNEPERGNRLDSHRPAEKPRDHTYTGQQMTHNPSLLVEFESALHAPHAWRLRYR